MSHDSVSKPSARRSQRGTWFPFAPEGLPIMIAFFIAAIALTALGGWLTGFYWPFAVATGVVCLWCCWFFRDPERDVPQDPEALVSPADGVIELISEDVPPPKGVSIGEAPRTRISVYMNVFNVHVNRTPLSGEVLEVAYHPGKFLHAAMDKASELNERMTVALQLSDGSQIALVQIAGLLARRIVCRVKKGDPLARGERFGVIRFGSRVDVYLPADAEPVVPLGTKVKAGETIIARRKGQDMPVDKT